MKFSLTPSLFCAKQSFISELKHGTQCCPLVTHGNGELNHTHPIATKGGVQGGERGKEGEREREGGGGGRVREGERDTISDLHTSSCERETYLLF